jgi:hypothetical protein
MRSWRPQLHPAVDEDSPDRLHAAPGRPRNRGHREPAPIEGNRWVHLRDRIVDVSCLHGISESAATPVDNRPRIRDWTRSAQVWSAAGRPISLRLRPITAVSMFR